MGSMTKLNHRFALIEYPITLDELETFSKDFPKSERKFYEYAIKALRKVMNKDEKINYLTDGSTVTKVGFTVISEEKVILVLMKGGLLGGAGTEIYKYKDIKEVDFDIIHGLFGIDNMNPGILYLYEKGLISKKKHTIRNIPEHDLDKVVNLIRDKI